MLSPAMLNGALLTPCTITALTRCESAELWRTIFGVSLKFPCFGNDHLEEAHEPGNQRSPAQRAFELLTCTLSLGRFHNERLIPRACSFADSPNKNKAETC